MSIKFFPFNPRTRILREGNGSIHVCLFTGKGYQVKHLNRSMWWRCPRCQCGRRKEKGGWSLCTKRGCNLYIYWHVAGWFSTEGVSCLMLDFCLHVGREFPVRSSQPISKTEHYCCGQSWTNQIKSELWCFQPFDIYSKCKSLRFWFNVFGNHFYVLNEFALSYILWCYICFYAKGIGCHNKGKWWQCDRVRTNCAQAEICKRFSRTEKILRIQRPIAACHNYGGTSFFTLFIVDFCQPCQLKPSRSILRKYPV